MNSTYSGRENSQGRDGATVTQAARSVENLLDVEDQKTINAIKRVRDEIAKSRRVSGEKKEAESKELKTKV